MVLCIWPVRPLRIAQLCIAFRITPLLWVVYCVLRICIAYLPWFIKMIRYPVTVLKGMWLSTEGWVYSDVSTRMLWWMCVNTLEYKNAGNSWEYGFCRIHMNAHCYTRCWEYTNRAGNSWDYIFRLFTWECMWIHWDLVLLGIHMRIPGDDWEYLGMILLNKAQYMQIHRNAKQANTP